MDIDLNFDLDLGLDLDLDLDLDVGCLVNIWMWADNRPAPPQSHRPHSIDRSEVRDGIQMALEAKMGRLYHT